MSHWDDMPTMEEMYGEAMAALCCMTDLEKYHHMYSRTWGRPTDSTFVEVKRPDKMTHI